jgi:mRNA-degrading endonuclease RelE of RelBE toxin-antitoxin system
MGSSSKQPLAYKVFFTKRCEHRFRKLQDSVKREVGKVIDDLGANPRLGYPLKDPVLKDLYSIHCAELRIIYKFTDNPAEIELWAIEHRKHVYEELMRYKSSTKQPVLVF